MKKALIIGHSGQDGFYLQEFLGAQGYAVYGISLSETLAPAGTLLPKGDISEKNYVDDVIEQILPDELYYLAAVHQSSMDIHVDDLSLFNSSFKTNTLSFINFLDALSRKKKDCKVFYAASSHIFGNPATEFQDESTPIQPNCVYGISKTAGIQAGKFYTEKYGLFVSVGLFYNHESARRSNKFVSRKIVETAVAIKKGIKNKLILGNISAIIDWGYAPDYVRAAHALLQLKTPGMYIISSGEKHTVQDFVEAVFNELELDWKPYVETDPALLTKSSRVLIGNNKKLKQDTGWAPSTDFKGMIKILVQAELNRL